MSGPIIFSNKSRINYDRIKLIELFEQRISAFHNIDDGTEGILIPQKLNPALRAYLISDPSE